MTTQASTAGTPEIADAPTAGRVARVQAAASAAAAAASAVDRESRFPKEAFAEIRRQKLLGIMVPKALGGEGASMSDIVDICYRLGRACGSTGLIYAMHQVKLACLVPYTAGQPALERILRRIASEQLLLASSTTEGLAGANIRESEAPVITVGERISLERKATCISYGLEADGIVTTARRAPDAAPSDQVLLVFLKSAYTLEPSVTWDTLGMRGTCSEGYTLRAVGDRGNILPLPYERIHARSMVPTAHLFWGAVWAGIAAAAVTRARDFIRAASRHSGGRLPPGAAHLTTASASLQTLLGLLSSATRRFELALQDPDSLQSLEFQTMITMTKVEASELAVTTVLRSLRACGLAGYRNDSPFAMGRFLRDVLSSPIMINNDRILAGADPAVLMSEAPTALSL